MRFLTSDFWQQVFFQLYHIFSCIYPVFVLKPMHALVPNHGHWTIQYPLMYSRPAICVQTVQDHRTSDSKTVVILAFGSIVSWVWMSIGLCTVQISYSVLWIKLHCLLWKMVIIGTLRIVHQALFFEWVLSVGMSGLEEVCWILCLHGQHMPNYWTQWLTIVPKVGKQIQNLCRSSKWLSDYAIWLLMGQFMVLIKTQQCHCGSHGMQPMAHNNYRILHCWSMLCVHWDVLLMWWQSSNQWCCVWAYSLSYPL